MTYDALGRVVTWSEAGSTGAPVASNAFEYDLNGNIRRSTYNYRKLDDSGAPSSSVTTTNAWYKYDAQNHVLIEKGTLIFNQNTNEYMIVPMGPNGAIISDAVPYSYDAAGQRKTTSYITASASGSGTYVPNITYNSNLDTYNYNPDGTLQSVDITTNGTTRRAATYDAMGRLTRQRDWDGDGTNASYDKAITYNAKGQAESDIGFYKQMKSGGGEDTVETETTNSYGTGTSYALGAVTYSETETDTLGDGNSSKTSSTTNFFDWWDGAVQSEVRYKANKNQSSQFESYYSYDAWGTLDEVAIDDDRNRVVTFINDLNGQIIRRDQSDNRTDDKGEPHEVWYRYNGAELGYTGNNATDDLGYAASVYDRRSVKGTGDFRNGGALGEGFNDEWQVSTVSTSRRKGPEINDPVAGQLYELRSASVRIDPLH